MNLSIATSPTVKRTAPIWTRSMPSSLRWSTNIPQVMPVLTSNALLKETVPVANNLDQIINDGT